MRKGVSALAAGASPRLKQMAVKIQASLEAFFEALFIQSSGKKFLFDDHAAQTSQSARMTGVYDNTSGFGESKNDATRT
jgi:hypothetical protein